VAAVQVPRGAAHAASGLGRPVRGCAFSWAAHLSCLWAGCRRQLACEDGILPTQLFWCGPGRGQAWCRRWWAQCVSVGPEQPLWKLVWLAPRIAGSRSLKLRCRITDPHGPPAPPPSCTQPSKNMDASQHNAAQLARLPGPQHEFHAGAQGRDVSPCLRSAPCSLER
jgi:hypothetical protein